MTKLTEILREEGRLLTTEFLPPKTPTLSPLVDKVLRLVSVVDAVSLPELKANPTSKPRFRMNPLFAALRLRELTGIETIFHLTPRDYNKNAVAGLLLAAAESNLTNVLVIGGDRYNATEETSLAKNVYDHPGTTNLVKAIRELEAEALGTSRFCIVVGTDPTVIYTANQQRIESEIEKLLERQDAGAELVQTQPVFDSGFFEFLDKARERGLKIPILVGILPLRDKSDSAAVETRYGITIPDEVKSRLEKESAEHRRKFILDLASDLVKCGVRNLHVYPREDSELVSTLARMAFSRSL